jgi:hypothetical protein
MHRENRLFTLDLEVISALKTRSQVSGVPMSRIVEEGLRHVLALPLPEVRGSEGAEESSTRTERAMLEVLRGLPAGWHSSVDLALAVGVSFAVGEKALKALARRGEVHRWGDARPFTDGSLGGGCWGLRAPLGLVRKGIAAWRAKGGREGDESALRLLGAVRELAKGIDTRTVARVRSECLELAAIDPRDLGVWNFAELAAIDARERVENELEIARAAQRESAERAERQRLENAAAAAMDANPLESGAVSEFGSEGVDVADID